MFCIVAKVFGNIKTDFLLKIGCLWLIFGWFHKFVATLVSLWMVCGCYGWFVGRLVGLWMVWVVCGWFRVLQLTSLFSITF